MEPFFAEIAASPRDVGDTLFNISTAAYGTGIVLFARAR
jgi:hypothetical protein